MSAWRVMVVEDDRVVARLHCRFVSQVAGYEVVGVAGTAARAERMVEALKPDLLLLDLGLPDENGIALLRRLRARGATVEAIAVTAATASQSVRATVHLGVVDYLVKPFDQERLRQSLSLFRRRMTMLAGGELVQREVDRICSDGPNSYRRLPRDLSEQRLGEIQRKAKDVEIGLAHVNEAGRDESIHETVQLERTNAIGIHLTGFIADNNDFEAIPNLKVGNKFNHSGVRL